MYPSGKKACMGVLAVVILLFAWTSAFAGIECGAWFREWTSESAPFEKSLSTTKLGKKKFKKFQLNRVAIENTLKEADGVCEERIGDDPDKSAANKKLKEYGKLIRELEKYSSDYLKILKDDSVKSLVDRKKNTRVLKAIVAAVKENYKLEEGKINTPGGMEIDTVELHNATETYKFLLKAFVSTEKSIADANLAITQMKKSGYTLANWTKFKMPQALRDVSMAIGGLNTKGGDLDMSGLSGMEQVFQQAYMKKLDSMQKRVDKGQNENEVVESETLKIKDRVKTVKVWLKKNKKKINKELKIAEKKLKKLM